MHRRGSPTFYLLLFSLCSGRVPVCLRLVVRSFLRGSGVRSRCARAAAGAAGSSPSGIGRSRCCRPVLRRWCRASCWFIAFRGRGARGRGRWGGPGWGLAWGGGEQADLVSVAGEHGQCAAAVPADIQLAEPGVIAGDGSLVAGLEPGVRVVGVFEDDAVTTLVARLIAHWVLLILRAGGLRCAVAGDALGLGPEGFAR